MGFVIVWISLLFGQVTQNAWAATPKQNLPPPNLVDRLTGLRGRVISLEQELLEGLRTQKLARTNMKKIQTLLSLQREERALGKRRIAELEKTVGDLEMRRGELNEKIKVQQRSIRDFLIAIEKKPLLRSPHEKIEAPRRRVLANLIDKGLKEIEAFKVDLADSEKLGAQIQEEKQQLAYLFQDLSEQESVLELNRQLQVDILRKKHQERVVQLENYQKLKVAESQVERLLSDFNSRLELERAVETERVASKASYEMMRSVFGRLKGKLTSPLAQGKIMSSFGRTYDNKSQLYVFKKGIDIAPVSGGKNLPVMAVSSGKVAFAGELPDYGKVAIIDHGDHFYTLCAHLGGFNKKIGDSVTTGEPIGQTDDLGTPVYFEIRARNVAVNPLQWLSN